MVSPGCQNSMPSLVEELLKEETPVQESSAVAALQAIEKALDLAQIRDMARAGLKS